MEKRYPYKTPWPWLCGVLLLIGVFTACVLLLVRDPNGGHIHPRSALIVGLSISALATLITMIMRWLHPPLLVLRDDGVYLPGRPKEGWRIAYADITELRLHPQFLGSRKMDMETQLRWWSISERCLPGKEAFDEIYSHIQSRVE